MPGEAQAFVIHRTTVTSGVTAASLAATFAKILSSATNHPDWEVGSIDCLGDGDEALIRRRNVDVAKPRMACLHDVISSQATRRPQSPAVCAPDGNLTYEELDRQASCLAANLIKGGLPERSIVPLCFEKSKYMIISMLAVFKAGAACTMLETSLPTERLHNMIQQVSAPLVLTSTLQISRFRNFTNNFVEVTQTLSQQTSDSESIRFPQISPSEVAIILFTSGSTGNPKGMLHEHVTINTSLQALARRLKLDDTTRISQFAAYSFDLSMIEILLPLTVGGCVCIPSEESRIENLAKCMEEMAVTFAMLTPSSIKLLKPEDVPSMKMVMVGGEPITGELIRIWEPCVTLINAWGTSECGICSCAVVTHALPTSIGRCMDLGAWIVDPDDLRRLVPVGAVGELIVEGPQVARGYLAEPEKTLASFIKSPPWLHEAPRGRLYRTGDLMRYLADGSMEYCGRKDSQVKIRGCRIELGEVEYHVTANSLVRNTMVSVPAEGIYQGRLVAVVQFNDSLGQDERSQKEADPIVLSSSEGGQFGDWVKTIITDLESKLPSQSIPEKWVVVDRLPITKSDKVDRKKMASWLIVLSPARRIPDAQNTASSNADPTLREVSRIIASIISQEDNSFDDNTLKSDSCIRAYGINSLSVVAVSAAIQESCKIQIAIKMLLDSSLTLGGLANLVRKGVSQKIMKVSTSTNGDSIHQPRSCKALKDFLHLKSKILEQAQLPTETPGRCVFLTGATGYVGSHILRSLLTHPHVRIVCVLVRASSQAYALTRIITAAQTGRWWSDGLLPKLEVWLGDLGQVDLGLSKVNLTRLQSCTDPSRAVDSIVHNGALVHWLADYEELRQTNVSSTAQLLEITRLSKSISNFVYISSDPETHFDAALWKNDDLASHLSQLNGYRQTKAVSELLVRSVASVSSSPSRRFSLIKPGFVVGSHDDGVANIDDFLWRLSASVVRLNAYDSNEATGWIYVASVDVITDSIIETLFAEPAENERNAAVADGMKAERFWEILETVSGQTLRPLPHDEWLALLRQDVFKTGSQHPLWPLLHLLEDENLTLTATVPPSTNEACSTYDPTHAVKNGLAQLNNLGLLSSNTAWPGAETPSCIFQRSGRSKS